MGTSLNGLTPAGTYPGLIKTGDNAPIDGTLKTLSDGNGNNLPMAVSTTTINLTGTAQVGGVAIANTTQVAAKQDTLVSGTNIKTINGASLLGSGDIPVVTSPSGVAGAIQFSNGSAFASDAANLFWDDTNNRLGVGTNAPSATTHIVGAGSTLATTALLVQNSAGTELLKVVDGGSQKVVTIPSALIGTLSYFGSTVESTSTQTFKANGVAINGDYSSPAASTRLHIKGSGTTSATTSLLVQNSGGSAAFQVKDNQQVQINLGSTLSDVATPNLTFSSTQTGIYSPNPNQLGIVCYANETARFIYGNALHNGALNIGKFANPDNNAFFGWCSDGSLEITGNAQSVFVNPTNNKSLIVGASTENTSAILQADSTTKGFLPPRMTTTQKNAIATPASGLVVYDSTTNKLCCYDGSTWNDLF